MPVLKNKTQGRFVSVNRNIVEDKNLRLVDRGLLLTLLSLPDNWDFSIKGMTHILPEGKAAISASFERLIKRGYIRKEQVRDETGRFAETAIEVFDVPFKPLPEKRATDDRATEKPPSEKQAQLNTKGFNNKEFNNKEMNKAEKKNAGKEKYGTENVNTNPSCNNKASGDSHSTEIDLYGFPVSDM